MTLKTILYTLGKQGHQLRQFRFALQAELIPLKSLQGLNYSQCYNEKKMVKCHFFKNMQAIKYRTRAHITYNKLW